MVMIWNLQQLQQQQKEGSGCGGNDYSQRYTVDYGFEKYCLVPYVRLDLSTECTRETRGVAYASIRLLLFCYYMINQITSLNHSSCANQDMERKGRTFR